jgi:RHS repeat-associated protein
MAGNRRRWSTARHPTLCAGVNDRGHAISMVHDTVGRVLEARDARGNRLRRNYDAAGNAVEITRYEISDLDATEGFSTTRMAFDGLDRMVRRTDAAGNVLEFAYDSRGHAVLERDAARATPESPGNAVRRVFDGLDRLIEERRVLTDSGNGSGQVVGEIVLRRQWDGNSRLTGVTDGNGHLTQLEYDSLDRLIRKTGPDGLATTLTYSAHSDVTVMTEPRGTTIRQTFDALGRLVRRDVVPGDGVDAATTFEERVYDGRSRLVRGWNDATRLELGHDSLGNLTLDSVNGRAVRVAHDGSGNPRRILYPGGRTLEAEYDVLDQLTSIADVTQGSAVPIVRHRYAGPGRLARREYGNGLRWDLTYDLAKRPVRSTHLTEAGQVLEDRAYAWDSNHLKTQDRDLRPGGLGQEYQYDAAHRLQAVVTTGALAEARTYRWDAAGNRLAVEGDGDTGAYVLAGAPSNDAVLNQYTRTPFDERRYDAGGNLVEIEGASSGVSRLKFDYLNRLVGVEAGGRSVRYHLDLLGRRVERVEGENDIVRYAYLGGQRIEEQDRSGTVLATYVYGLGLNDVISMRRNGADIWFHGDPQQTIRMATSGQGAVVERYQYDEFGNPALFDAEGRSIPASVVGNPFLFTGHVYDEESGLYHARRRSYDPRAGRFISRDPAGAWTDPYAAGNAYTYAGNNPATFVDPLGLAAALPQPEDFVAPGLNAPAAILLSQSRNLAAQTARLLSEAEHINSAMAKELLDWTDDFLRGAVQLEGEGGKLVRVMAESTDEAVSLVNSMYGSGRINPLRGPKDWDRFVSEMGSMARQSHWYADTTDKLVDMEARAARMAQRGSRLAQAGKLLGGAGIALETGLAAYDNYRNCADAVTSVNDTVGTAAASGLVLAAPPLAVVDLVTGGAVTGSIHNALITPVTAARVVFGDVNGRDARAIKSTYTRFAVGRWAWSAGEWLADKLID